MLKLNQEYTYKKICEELGWKESSGGQKQKQIKEIESSFEFYHPENKKTHKPKKSYIFTKQLKEPELRDKRITNGGVKKIPDTCFEYLFKCILLSGIEKNGYHQRGMMNDIYLSSSLIFKEFGFDVYKILHDVCPELNSDYIDVSQRKVVRLFQEMCINTVRTHTITRICRLLKYPANSLPKGILRKENQSSAHTVPDDELLGYYDIYMKWFLDFYKLKSELAAVKCGKYFEITEAIKNEFAEHHKKYDVKKLNKITIESVNYVEDFEPESAVKLTLQDAFLRTMMGLILDKIQKRCLSEKEYSIELDFDEKMYLLELFTKMFEMTECSDSKITERVDELEDQLKKQMGQDLDKALEGVKI